MNRMYRLQRHVYDFTRRYYLLGRNQMLARLSLADDAKVLEIGCGTGRNLVHAARLYSNTQFFGIDISTEMMTSAEAAITRHGLTKRVRIAEGDATSFDTSALFDVDSFDAVFISYSLSMIPQWRLVLGAAVAHLKPNGRLHIVDFGLQAGLPGPMRSLVLQWLALFDVTPREDLEQALVEIAIGSGGQLTFEHPFRGYAQYAVLTLSSLRN